MPLARAAQSLVQMGLIEVWEEPVGVGEGGLMLSDLAAEAVSNPENWWRYDLDRNGIRTSACLDLLLAADMKPGRLGRCA
jgi:hypothetical protein